MRVRLITLVAALFALALIPSTAAAAPKKVFLKFSAGSYSVAENAGHFDLTVSRSGNTRVAASVNVQVTGGSATNGNQYSFTSPTPVSFAANETTKKVSVTLNDNGSLDGNKTVTFGLTGAAAPGATAQTKAPSTATLTIVDDEGPGLLDFSSSAYTVLESGGFATITVNRIGATNISVSVDYMTQAAALSPATPTADYTPIPSVPVRTLTFAPGEMSKTVQVQITDDSAAESPENVNVVLFHPQNLSGGNAPVVGANSPAVLTINDDDVPTFSFDSTLFSAGEGAGNAIITVNRGGATNVPASVDWSTADGTATAGSDYTAATGTLNFAAGQTQKTFTVAITQDVLDEPNETVDLSLTSGAAAELSIVDDDIPTESVQFSDTSYTVNEAAASGHARITVQLSHELTIPTSVHYATSDGTAGTVSPNLDYTATSGTLNFAAHDTEETFDIPITNDLDPEDDETVNLTLSSAGPSLMLGDPTTATLTITDDDPPGLLDFKSLTYNATETGLVATVTVQRVGGVGGPVAVDYATSDGTANAGSDYTATSGTLNWATGDDADKTFNVPVTWDGAAEGPEAINLALSNVAGADLGANTAAVIQLADDGASGPTRFTANSYNVNEADGQVTITVTRSGGSLGGPVTVDYATGDGTATAGSDYTAASGTLTFGAGELTKSFTVPVANDSTHEDGETFQVTLSNVTGGASMGTPSGASVTIGDDDAAPTAAADNSPNLQSTPANPNPSGSQTAATDKRAPKLTLSAKKIQKAFKAKVLALAARCDENCKLTVVAKFGKGKKAITLGKANVKASRGAKKTIKIKLSKKALAKLTKVLKAGKVKVTISVVAADAAGNKRSAARAVTVKR